MKTKYTKKEIARSKVLQARFDKLEEMIKTHEKVLDFLKIEKHNVFAEFCHIINPNPLPFDKILLPYGWDR